MVSIVVIIFVTQYVTKLTVWSAKNSLSRKNELADPPLLLLLSNFDHMPDGDLFPSSLVHTYNYKKPEERFLKAWLAWKRS